MMSLTVFNILQEENFSFPFPFYPKYIYLFDLDEFPFKRGSYINFCDQREILEELNVSVQITSQFLTVVHQYPDFELIMHSYLCNVESREITLNEHISHQWLKIEELDKLDWAAADVPIVNKLILNG